MNKELEIVARQILESAENKAKNNKTTLSPIIIATIIYYIIRIIILIQKSQNDHKDRIKLFKSTNIFKRIWLKGLIAKEMNIVDAKDRKYIYEATLAYMKDAKEEEISTLLFLDLENEK